MTGTPTHEAAQASLDTPKSDFTGLSRDELRARIFGSKAKEELVDFFGQKVFLKEPTTDKVLEFQADRNRKEAVAKMLIDYVFLPVEGPNGPIAGPPVFEEGDVDMILQLPFGKDMSQLQTKILALLGVSPTDADKSGTAEE